MPSLSSDVPRRSSAADRRGELLSQPLFDHWLPGHQREPHAVIEHRIAPAGKHDATPVDAGHALAISHWPMLQPGFVGNVLRGLCQLSTAQRCQQVAREDDALPAMLGQPLFGQKIGALA